MIESIINFYIPIICGFYLFFKSPIKLAILIPAFQYLRFGISIGFTIIYAIDFYNLLIVIYLLSQIRKNKLKFITDFGGKMILLFTSLFFLKIIIGSNNDTPRVLYDYIFLFITFIFYINVLQKSNWIKAIHYFAISKLIVVTYSLIFLAFPNSFPQAYNVTYGIIKTDLFFRFGLLQQASYLFIYVLIFFKGYRKIVFLILLLLLVLLSGSRTQLIICFSIGTYYYLVNFYVRKRFYHLAQSLVIILILSFGAIYIGNNPSFSKIVYRFNALVEDPSKAGGARKNYFENSWTLSKGHIIFGNPIYNSKEIAGRFTNDWMPVLTGRTHNVYLAILYAFGVLGLLPIVIMLINYFMFSIKAFYLKNQTPLLFLHMILLASIIEGFTAGVYFSYVADVLIISLIMFHKYHSVKAINISNNKKIQDEKFLSLKGI